MRGRAPLRSLPLLLLLLVLLLVLLGSAAETPPYLPAPQNVEVYSYNFQSVLRWSPVPVENGTVLYTAQYTTSSYEHWSDLGCARSPQPQCWLPPELQRRRRWTILLRVRAELGTLASPWARCPAFVAATNSECWGWASARGSGNSWARWHRPGPGLWEQLGTLASPWAHCPAFVAATNSECWGWASARALGTAGLPCCWLWVTG
ncbi:interferon gamma receptor 2-like [Geothlypis trichas]